MAHSRLAGKGLFTLKLWSPIPSLRESRAWTGTWRQKPKQGPLRSSVYWLAPQVLLISLLCTALDHLPRGDNSHNDLCTPKSIINLKEMPPTDLLTGLPDGDTFPLPRWPQLVSSWQKTNELRFCARLVEYLTVLRGRKHIEIKKHFTLFHYTSPGLWI